MLSWSCVSLCCTLSRLRSSCSSITTSELLVGCGMSSDARACMLGPWKCCISLGTPACAAAAATGALPPSPPSPAASFCGGTASCSTAGSAGGVVCGLLEVRGEGAGEGVAPSEPCRTSPPSCGRGGPDDEPGMVRYCVGSVPGQLLKSADARKP